MYPSHAFRRRAVLVLGALALSAAPGQGRAEELGAATYVRTDSDDTTVIAPRLRTKGEVTEETSISLVYAVDVWTSASIDIVTSASPRPVTEQRDEIDLSIDHEMVDLTFTGAYRYSTEPDYESHGGTGGFGYDFAQKNAQLGVSLSASIDEVGRAGDPDFARSVSTYGGRLSFTQVLSAEMLVQVLYQPSVVTGYQASPYRFVGIGGDGRCNGTAPLCVPEVNPDDRLRHALAAQGRYALDDEWSLGSGYRFYLDDWGVLAHTLHGELAYVPGSTTILSARYRFYTQGAADHYQPTYMAMAGLVTSDKELSSLSSHRLELELEQSFNFRGGRSMSLVVSVAPLFYSYDNFVPLESITAFEANAALSLVL